MIICTLHGFRGDDPDILSQEMTETREKFKNDHETPPTTPATVQDPGPDLVAPVRSSRPAAAGRAAGVPAGPGLAAGRHEAGLVVRL